MKNVWTGFRWIYLALVLCPGMLLAVWTLRLLVPATIDRAVDAQGRTSLVVRLGSDPLERSRGEERLLGSTGAVSEVRTDSFRFERDTQAFQIWLDDGPPILARIRGVVTDSGDTLRGLPAEIAVVEMPEAVRYDRNRLAAGVAAGRDDTGFGRAMEAWNIFRRADAGIVALVSDGNGPDRAIRLGSIRRVRKSPDGFLATVRGTAGNLRAALWDVPDAWSGGGLRPVVVSTFLLVLLAGVLGGIPALIAAVHLADQTHPGRWAVWVRRSAEGLSAVPGVVWGTIGAGLLVSVLGFHLDQFLGAGVRYGTGGLLWGALTLGALAAPTTLAQAMAALDQVPREWREIARSCGATRHQVLSRVVLPASARGLLSAWIAGLARSAGETAPLLVVGAVRSMGGTGAGSWGVPSLSGGFLHLGVLACDPPWPPLEAETGHPLAFLAMLALALLCLGLEVAALRAGGRRIVTNSVLDLPEGRNPREEGE